MPLDPANYIDDLSVTDPAAGDAGHQADDQMRALKKAIKQTFPNGFSSPLLGVTQALLNGFEARIAALEAVGAPTWTTPVIGTFTASADASNEVITGIGFEPSIIVFFTAATLSGAAFCVGISGVGVLTIGTNGTYDFHIGQSGTSPDCYITLKPGATHTVRARGNVSIDADGFTVTKVTYVSAVDVVYMAFA